MQLKYLGLAASVVFTSHAAAQCGANSVVQDIETLLNDKTVCATGVNASAGDRWQEWHQTDGTLTEYARGPSDPVDPTHDVGTWAEVGNGANSKVQHNYTGGQSYEWSVHDIGGGSYSFCTEKNGTQVATATLLTGQQACGF
jgi:hypothetical protein